jgi:hypothetical protein
MAELPAETSDFHFLNGIPNPLLGIDLLDYVSVFSEPSRQNNKQISSLNIDLCGAPRVIV